MLSHMLTEQEDNAEDTSNSNTNINDAEKQEARGLYEYLTTTGRSKYSDFNEILAKKFAGVFQSLTDQRLSQLCEHVAYASTRNVKDLTPLAGVNVFFPVLDLLATLHNKSFKGAATNRTDADSTADQVKTNFEKQSSRLLYPLDYVPLNAWANVIKTAILSSTKNDLGKMRIDDINGNSSMYQVIMNLLSIRKKILLPKIPASILGVDGSSTLNTIFKQPWTLIEGKTPINDEKLRIIYDDITARELVDISRSAYVLYRQQISEAFNIYNSIYGENKKLNFKDVEQRLLKDAKTYSLFIGDNKPAVPVDWKAVFDSVVKTESFSIFLNNRLTLEEQTRLSQLNNDRLVKLVVSRMQKDKTFLQKLQDHPQLKSLFNVTSNNSPTTDQTSTSSAGQQESSEPQIPQSNFHADRPVKRETALKFLYNKERLDAAVKSGDTLASDFWSELVDFANYVKTKGSRDLMGGATQLAQAMSLGVKNVGT